MLANGHRQHETQVALEVACDAIAYLTIVAATMNIGSPGVEYAPAWLHLNEFIARAERLLATIDPSAPLELRTKIRENAMHLQEAINKYKAKKIS
jgi:hypothetical protein